MASIKISIFLSKILSKEFTKYICSTVSLVSPLFIQFDLALLKKIPKFVQEKYFSPLVKLEELKKETITTERDNGQIQETGTSITIDAEEVNDAKTQLLRKYQEMNEASRLAWLRQHQQQEDRSKQMASWRMMMQPYMSAQGGRVPAGYNTGGLSNLFKLKNR